MKHKTILIILTLFLSISAFSRPARKGIIPLMQPDGTVFNAIMKGDEFIKVTTTLEGNAIVQDKDGWWCYATFDTDGKRSSSGWKVGQKTPVQILSESSLIPYDILSGAARERRRILQYANTGVVNGAGPHTKTGSSGTKHGLVILAQFSDVDFRFGKEDFVDMLTQEGYSRNGATGSAKEYFNEQFGGKLKFEFEVCDIVTLSGKRAEYGANLPDGQDKAPERMVIEACRAVDDEIDFTLYDEDHDGEIDNVFIFFAGGDEADGEGEDCIWSHSWYVYNGAGQSVILDGKMLNKYSCASELISLTQGNGSPGKTLTGIGTFCHEYSHTLGLPDLYDTDYEGSGGEAAGVWIWTSLMDGGNQNNHGNTPPHFNAIEREKLGLCEPVLIQANGTYSLGPVHETNMIYRLDTDTVGEYYLIEFRNGKGWDEYIGGSGMLVYHIDRSERYSGYSDLYNGELKASDRWNLANEVNCRPDHQCADLIEADNRKDGFQSYEYNDFKNLYRNISPVFFPQGGITSIAPERLGFWSGSQSTVEISDIRRDGDVIRFNVKGLSSGEIPPGVSTVKTETFPDAAIINFESDRPFDGNAIIEWGRPDDKMQTTIIQPYEPGKYAILLEGLVSGNKTYSVNICFETDGTRGDIKTISFMTRRSPVVNWPYIYMNGVDRNDDDTIPHGTLLPLRLCNATDAAEIRWTYDGEPVTVGGDQYYKVVKSGILKAHITWRNGTEDTIMKEIILGKEE